MISAIFAVDENGTIGYNNSMPWPKNTEDLEFFKTTTLHQVVIMGRKTWESKGMPKPLPNRTNVVITRNPTLLVNCITVNGDVCSIIKNKSLQYSNNEIFVIGGLDILLQSRPVLDRIFITRIPGKYPSDVKMDVDNFITDFTLVNTISFSSCKVEEYSRD